MAKLNEAKLTKFKLHQGKANMVKLNQAILAMV